MNKLKEIEEARKRVKEFGAEDIVACVPATEYVDVICKRNGENGIIRVYDDGRVIF